MHLFNAAKRAKPSAVGLDAWSHEELASLPMDAWYWFILVVSLSPMSVLSSISAIFRRYPSPKHPPLCVCQKMSDISTSSVSFSGFMPKRPRD